MPPPSVSVKDSSRCLVLPPVIVTSDMRVSVRRLTVGVHGVGRGVHGELPRPRLRRSGGSGGGMRRSGEEEDGGVRRRDDRDFMR